jgi:hypothetical protein
MRRLDEHNGLMGVGLHLELRNIGKVRAHFLGIAVNVYGQRIVGSTPHVRPERDLLQYDFNGFYRTESQIPVYSFAYITHLGNPSTGQDTTLDPGSSLENDRTLYVPHGRFDLLTVGIDAPYTKFDEATIPTHLTVSSQGSARVVTTLSSKIEPYNINPVTSLDVR